MTIGWISQFIDGNAIVDGIEDPAESVAPAETAALVTGSFLSGKDAPLTLALEIN